MNPLTERQQAVLDFLRDYLRANGYPPTFREVMAHFGFKSTNAVNDYLRVLERKGHVRVDRTRSRGIQLRGEASEADRRLARLIEDVKRVALALGVDLGRADDPLPKDWQARCIAAAQGRATA